MMKYAHYDVMDFVLDEYFQQRIKFPDAENISFWESFLINHPEKREIIAEAGMLILLMDFQKTSAEKISDSQLMIQRMQTSNKTKGNDSSIDQVSGKPVLKLNAYHFWLLIATAILFVLGYFILLWFFTK